MRVNKLKISLKTEVFLSSLFFSCVSQWRVCLLCTQGSLQERNAGDERESISAGVLPGWFLLVAGLGDWCGVFFNYCVQVCIFCVLPQCEVTVVIESFWIPFAMETKY